MTGDFRKAVESFRAAWAARLDKRSLEVLDRLVSDDWRWRAEPVFHAVPCERWDTLLSDCLSGEREARLQKSTVEACLRAVERAAEAAKALEKVAVFVAPQPAGDPLGEALGMLRTHIFYRGLDAQRELKRRSRKTTDAAARAAGIGWIAASIRKLSGAANTRLAADLAAAVFDGDVTESAVRKAPTPQERYERSLRG